jgi:hypothetical protein
MGDKTPFKTSLTGDYDREYAHLVVSGTALALSPLAFDAELS